MKMCVLGSAAPTHALFTAPVVCSILCFHSPNTLCVSVFCCLFLKVLVVSNKNLTPFMESKNHNAYSGKRINWGSFSKSLSRDAEPYEDLSAFGYTAKMYYDSEKYAWIQSGRHLIPWMGHEELLIDRFVPS